MYEIKKSPEDFVVEEIPSIKLKEHGEYGIYLLKKKMRTTEQALTLIGERLKIPRKDISAAGNKDKVALTSQYISIRRCSHQGFSLKGVSIELVGFSDQPLALGHLEGNKFIIKVNTDQQPKHLPHIINYFGSQRFSVKNVPIGKALVKKEFKEACSLIISTSSYAERIEKHLAETPTDFVGALRLLPRNLLKLYVHAYQSSLWNALAALHAGKPEAPEQLPIIGFGTEETAEVQRILQEEDISTRDFIIHQIPELSSEGGMRDLFVQAQNLNIEKIETGYTLSFQLPKGSYATEVIRQMFL